MLCFCITNVLFVCIWVIDRTTFHFGLFIANFTISVYIIPFLLSLFPPSLVTGYLKPLGTGISLFFEDTSLFGFTVPPGTARRTSTPAFGITKDTIVLNVKFVLVIVAMEMIPARFAIVTDILIPVASWEARSVTGSQFGTIFQRVGRIVAKVRIGIEEIERLELTLVVVRAFIGSHRRQGYRHHGQTHAQEATTRVHHHLVCSLSCLLLWLLLWLEGKEWSIPMRCARGTRSECVKYSSPASNALYSTRKHRSSTRMATSRTVQSCGTAGN